MPEQTLDSQYPYKQEFEQPADPVQEEEQMLDEEDAAEQQDRFEDQQETYEDVEWSNVPQQRKNDSLYTLFGRVWRTNDSSKVANLDKTELGPHPVMAVRQSQFIGLLGAYTKHKKFAEFFYKVGEITLATSASKKGWFTELFVSQKKSTSRFSGNNLNNLNQFKPKRRFSLFGAGSNEQVQNE